MRGDMLGAGQHLQVVERVRVAAVFEREAVMYFQAARTAGQLGTVSGPSQRRAPRPFPPAAVERRVPGAHATNTDPQSNAGAGRSIIGSASPAAITAALSRSMRPREFARSSPGLPFPSRRRAEFAHRGRERQRLDHPQPSAEHEPLKASHVAPAILAGADSAKLVRPPEPGPARESL